MQEGIYIQTVTFSQECCDLPSSLPYPPLLLPLCLSDLISPHTGTQTYTPSSPRVNTLTLPATDTRTHQHTSRKWEVNTRNTSLTQCSEKTNQTQQQIAGTQTLPEISTSLWAPWYLSICHNLRAWWPHHKVTRTSVFMPRNYAILCLQGNIFYHHICSEKEHKKTTPTNPTKHTHTHAHTCEQLPETKISLQRRGTDRHVQLQNTGQWKTITLRKN